MVIFEMNGGVVKYDLRHIVAYRPLFLSLFFHFGVVHIIVLRKVSGHALQSRTNLLSILRVIFMGMGLHSQLKNKKKLRGQVFLIEYAIQRNHPSVVIFKG